VKIEAIVGERIRSTREQRKLSQPELGKLLEPLLGTAWPKQTVSGAERGKRSFTASDLVALAHVLNVPVGFLLKPPMGVEEVELGSGASISTSHLHEASIPDDAKREALHDLGRTLSELATIVDQSTALLGTAASLYNELEVGE
jgi:transcriptional regulator with XRE-family HTH domain